MRLLMRQFVDEKSNDGTVIEKVASVMFGNIGRTDVVLAAVSPDGSCVSSRPDVLGRVFSDQQMLTDICSRIDDGQELVITQSGDFIIAASDITCESESIGYCLMLLPGCSPEKSFEYIDFIEMILKQFSTLATLIGRKNQSCWFGQKINDSELFPILATAN